MHLPVVYPAIRSLHVHLRLCITAKYYISAVSLIVVCVESVDGSPLGLITYLHLL